MYFSLTNLRRCTLEIIPDRRSSDQRLLVEAVDARLLVSRFKFLQQNAENWTANYSAVHVTSAYMLPTYLQSGSIV